MVVLAHSAVDHMTGGMVLGAETTVLCVHGCVLRVLVATHTTTRGTGTRPMHAAVDAVIGELHCGRAAECTNSRTRRTGAEHIITTVIMTRVTMTTNTPSGAVRTIHTTVIKTLTSFHSSR